MKVSRKNKHSPPSQFPDLFCAPSAANAMKASLFLIFTNFSAITSSSKVNFHIPHGCDLRSNETEQNSNVKIGCVRCQER